MGTANDNRVLALGVYLVDQPNYAVAISETLRQTKDWDLDLRWAAVGQGPPPDALRSETVTTVVQRQPKFRLLNRMLEAVDIDRYRFLVITDDDIELPGDFLDTFLRIQDRHDLALAQPARSHDSFIDHHFVAQLLGVEARRTRFVEIGPLFSVRRDIFPSLLPFDEEAPMGWGLDFVWPVLLEQQQAHMGIVDLTPLRHALRKPVALYDYDETAAAMRDFLSHRQHLTTDEAFLARETYPISHHRAHGGGG